MLILKDLEKLVWTGIALLVLCTASAKAAVLVDLATPDEADIQVSGEIANDESGTSVATGDINGDGKQDLILGVPFAHQAGSDPGEVVVIWGSATFPSPHNLDLAFATKNLLIKGVDNDDRVGHTVVSGDINNDGVDDLIIGAPYADPLDRTNAGEIYVIYGSAAFGISQTIDLSIGGVDPDLTLQGVAAGDRWGRYLSVGDINADGIDDILLSSPDADYASAGRTNCGAAMVIYGSASFAPNEVKDLDAGADITVYGDLAWEFLGGSVAAGEVNGVVGDDLLIGGWAVDGPGSRTNSGVVYAIWGSTSFPPNYVLDQPLTQADFRIWGAAANDYLGSSVASSDFNGDGLDDIMVSAVQVDSAGRMDAGEVYVLYGSLAFPATWDLANVGTPPDIRFRGAQAWDNLGRSLGSVDMKGDGIQDMIIGAPVADPMGRTDAGRVYVVHGSASFPSAHVVDFLAPGKADLEVYGKQAGDRLGWSVAGGDMGGNFFGDLLMGAPKADPQSRTWAGESYVVYGRPDPTPTPTATATKTVTSTQSETWTSTPTFTLTQTSDLSSTQTETSTQSPTYTSTPTNTPTHTVTATYTVTQTDSPSPTFSPTFTHTLTAIDTPTATPTFTATLSDTSTHTQTFTPVISSTYTSSPTLSLTQSPTRTQSPTETSTMTSTATKTETKTATLTATPTLTLPLTQTQTLTHTPTFTVTETYTPTSTLTFTNTVLPSYTVTPTATSTATFTQTATPTATSTATFTATSTQTATPTDTVVDTMTPTPTMSPTASMTQTLTPTSLATLTVTSTPTPSPALPETVEAWPNPFRPNDAVRGTVKIGPVSTDAKVSLYTLAGEHLLSLEAGSEGSITWDIWSLSGGQRIQAVVVEWDGKTKSGLEVVEGLYFYVVEEDGKSVARGKIAVIR